MAPTSDAIDFSLFGGAEVLPPSYLTTPDSASASSDDELATSLSLSDEPESQLNEAGQSRGEAGKRYRLAGEEWAPKKVVPKQDPNDWLWMMTEEPHRSRRRAILKAHPEVSFLISSLV